VRDDLRERIEAGDVLVAIDGDDSPVLGALVLGPRQCGGHGGARDEGASADVAASAHVDAIAVRRARRGRGVGTALVRTASERHPRLTAEFDADVRPFYESLGFEVEAVSGEKGRFRGRYEREST
jgi:GNAT superfamily N-acetyltransferase